ncbi:hypothetical protein RCG17_22315 [Neobacillus sp. PS3-12]|uniref:hypothetical protein n=1 Tax=Neobacillus sp. PS3-12 TaxID=3070677 RepID=UPI0027E044E7|nr:hypothetical protein [Neobacillus sp. PS3-12]WML52107.1 hypothetical protein RCG17_22315 [Neobacillus sp. PS3-12]
METNVLFYKIQKGTITTEDYVNWSYSQLEKYVSSPSLNILSSFSFDDNLFEVEMYFKRAIDELAINEPTFDICARAYIGFLANKIKKAYEHTVIFDLADMIFQIAATELDNADDLFAWFEISEMIDRLNYDDQSFVLNEDDLISRIKNEAEILQRYIH